jgi:hypothetical protein
MSSNTIDSTYIDLLTEQLAKIRNELSINGALYTANEQRTINDLAVDITVMIKMNLNHGNHQ